MSYTQEELNQFQCIDTDKLYKRVSIETKNEILKNLRFVNIDDEEFVIFHQKSRYEFIGISKRGKIANISSREYLFRPVSANLIANTLKVKIVDSKLSGKFFGKKAAKKKMIGSIYDDYEIRYIKQTTIKDYTMCIRIIIDGESFTFAVCDVEFVIPSIKGYNIPKDLSFKTGQKVYSRKHKGEFEIIANLYRNKTSKKISRRSIDRRRDVFSCMQGDKIYHFFAEDLKHKSI